MKRHDGFNISHFQFRAWILVDQHEAAICNNDMLPKLFKTRRASAEFVAKHFPGEHMRSIAVKIVNFAEEVGK